MKILFTLVTVVLLLQSCHPETETVVDLTAPCLPETLERIEQQVPTGDGQGHGPDIGSDEWHSVVEFKLGVRGEDSVPTRNTQQWCAFVEQLAQKTSD